MMTITLEIPEELAAQLGNSPQQLSRHALEALVLEAYREDRIPRRRLNFWGYPA